ncbi:MAG: tetratricopeptide repeat protein [Melioribacteraceae bacterium]|nr:tetratricopeptide repeat protein [Melioribacteraceae bacterium]
MAKKKDTTEERIVAVAEALSKSEQFIERNQKILTYVVGGIIVVILLFFGYKKYISGPKEKTAQSMMFTAQAYFEKDSTNLALLGDGESYGFLDIIDDYGSTSAGNLSKYYAGICYFNQGEYEEAISYLKKFSGDDVIVPGMALGAIGDAYVQLNELEKAAKYYMDAANYNKNDFVSPAFLIKAGWTYEILGNWDKAKSAYEIVKKDYPKSREARDIDKYLARTKANLGEL